MLFNIKYYFCYKIACGIAKPIAIAVGMAMIFLLKSNSSNGITSRLYSRDIGFAIPLVAYWSGNITLHTNLFKFKEKYVSNSGFLFGRHSRLMAFTYFKQLLKNALELEFGHKYIFILSSTHISFKENLLCFSPPAKNNHGKFAQ